MSEEFRSILLVLDYQVGVGDRSYASAAAQQAKAAIETARKAKLPVAYSKVEFLPEYADIAPRNKAFAPVKEKNMMPAGSSKLIPLLEPASGEVVLSKNRFSAFSGNALTQLLRAKGINHLVIAGLDTSGVVLATFLQAEELDYGITILSDACTDGNTSLQGELMKVLFPRSAGVLTVSEWSATLDKTVLTASRSS